MFLPLQPLSGAYTILARSVGRGFRQTWHEPCMREEMCKALGWRKHFAQRKVLINLSVLYCCWYYCWHYKPLKNEIFTVWNKAKDIQSAGAALRKITKAGQCLICTGNGKMWQPQHSAHPLMIRRDLPRPAGQGVYCTASRGMRHAIVIKSVYT